jgi:hypothetical protein
VGDPPAADLMAVVVADVVEQHDDLAVRERGR